MAGSYLHIVNDEGKLESGENINAALECMSGDVTECITEMYGMIWWMASFISVDPERAAHLVEHARQNYHLGLARSPGVVREG